MGKYETIEFEVKDQVGIITINRPERRNSLAREVWQEIMEVLVDNIDNLDVRVIIMTGNDTMIKGRSAFSAGLGPRGPLGRFRHPLHAHFGGLAARV